MVHVDVEVVTGRVALADQLRLIGLVDGTLQRLALADELAAHIDVGGDGAHGEARDQRALDQRVRVVAQDIAVLASAGLRFVGIDDQIRWPPVALLGHERPFQAGRESGAAAAAQAACLHLVDDPVAPLGDEAGCVVPVSARSCSGQRLVERQERRDRGVIGFESLGGFAGVLHHRPFTGFPVCCLSKVVRLCSQALRIARLKRFCPSFKALTAASVPMRPRAWAASAPNSCFCIRFVQRGCITRWRKYGTASSPRANSMALKIVRTSERGRRSRVGDVTTEAQRLNGTLYLPVLRSPRAELRVSGSGSFRRRITRSPLPPEGRRCRM